ncbi:hypothetical protein A3A67_04360 [Candidatus Peribacteria bacterium RIFCSPLOWO2_01_FULL_51_18]|nr:MAG: hypothetical protein A3C52_02300 [Candidatus Peribacteria bacterium RIFCSPHIGHO2_02_FULL_51_15]OGJ66252.1 MAG: hypothetical protein A3A67_04360 [Candidatus Peribacteria bacterium RIFCSPLOWO2_01_FULL_51_18]OGJ68403.1 MAG: hypothetical protein A3J34_01295 [Candidatus Peribacteria bacterium RIFCSPLOWO2_02_FULL_51_10]
MEAKTTPLPEAERVLEHLQRLYDTEEEEKRKVPSGHTCLSDEKLADIVERTRVRLAGHDAGGKFIDANNDLKMLGRIEAPFTDWISRIQNAAKRDDFIFDEDNLNPEMRQAIENFHLEGGHTGEYSPGQRDYLSGKGLVLLIELEVRKDIFVTIGALSGLSRNPWTDEGEFFEIFPQFDLRDLHVDTEEYGSLKELARQSFLTCRSTIVPSTDHPLIKEQLQEKGETMPDQLQGQPLRRMGFAARAKSVMLGIAERFGNKYATSNIATLFYGDNPGGFENLPSTEFNKWMRAVAFRKEFKMVLDQRSRLRLRLQALMGKLSEGKKALVGPGGIASSKGHDIGIIETETRRWFAAIRHDIRHGNHKPW